MWSGRARPFPLGPTTLKREGFFGEMEHVGWAAAIVGGLSGIVWIVSHTLDQIPRVCRKAGKAVRSVRELRDEIRKSAHD